MSFDGGRNHGINYGNISKFVYDFSRIYVGCFGYTETDCSYFGNYVHGKVFKKLIIDIFYAAIDK